MPQLSGGLEDGELAFSFARSEPTPQHRSHEMDSTLEHDPHQPLATVARLLSTRGRFFAFLAAYFTLQFVVRLVTSPTVDLDEGEQLIATQQLAWGYGPQPPLYTWLQFPLIQLFGANVLPLCLLKNILLFCLYALTYLNARLLTRNHWLSMVATVSLLFIPQIVWESQRDLTHSVLVTVFAAATFHVVLQLGELFGESPGAAMDSNGTTLRWRSLKWFVALGLCVGCGVLSKYNYIVFFTGLIGAALMEHRWRRVLVSRGGLLSLSLCVVAILPHIIWVLANRDRALATASKLELLENATHLVASGAGLSNLGIAIVYYSMALLAVYGIVCFRKLNPPIESIEADSVRLIPKALVLMLGILLAGVLFFKVTGFKDRWFSPLLIWLPLLLVVKVRTRLNGKRVAIMIFLAFLVGASVLLAIPARIHFATLTHQPQRQNVSFSALTEGALRARNPRLIFAQNNFIGGNLKRCFPDAFVFNPLVSLRPVEPSGTECLVVWDATRTNLPRRDVLAELRQFVDVDWNGTNLHYVSAPMLHYPKKEARLGFANGKLK